MTKPSNFIMNTDYLALAQLGSVELTAVFAAATYEGDYTWHVRNIDFTAPNQKGALDRVLISVNGSDYYVARQVGFPLEAIQPHTTNRYMIEVERINPTTVRVSLGGYGHSTYTIPTQTVKVKVATFMPPNIF